MQTRQNPSSNWTIERSCVTRTRVSGSTKLFFLAAEGHHLTMLPFVFSIWDYMLSACRFAERDRFSHKPWFSLCGTSRPFLSKSSNSKPASATLPYAFSSTVDRHLSFEPPSISLVPSLIGRGRNALIRSLIHPSAPSFLHRFIISIHPNFFYSSHLTSSPLPPVTSEIFFLVS